MSKSCYACKRERRHYSIQRHYSGYSIQQRYSTTIVLLAKILSFHKLALSKLLLSRSSSSQHSVCAMQDIERAYNQNPYHNNIHAADVTQTLGCFLANDQFAQKLTDLEIASMIFATCIHDVGHPGSCLSFTPYYPACALSSMCTEYAYSPNFET